MGNGCVPARDAKNNVDHKSLETVTKAQTPQEKIAAWRNCNGVSS
jgi:hypothetical protein